MLVRPTDTVEAVAQRSERAHDVMKRLGLDQCCGRGLTLTQAAAAAGVPLDTLLTRLEEALAADVLS